ncbi:MAG: hypothetical protein KDD84_14385, partial [Caldilineaceae bacterium]|nr:hypothetical protein [Caldilineaceae bacterium]
GSHGGATAEGQAELLAGYNVTEAFCGAPIRSSMETIVVGEAPQGFPVHFDRIASEADHVFVCNRVKPHTGLEGPVESGLTKMLLIGLGKHTGAKIYHRAFQEYSWERISQMVARIVLDRCKVIGGLAIVENSYDETAIIHAVASNELLTVEPALLKKAYEMLPRLPFSRLDVLVIDQIGKNISGTGMDTNVISRLMIPRQPEAFGNVDTGIITVLDLTEPTHGNIAGLGLANVTTARVFSKIDWVSTYTNAVTSGIFGMFRTHLPITMADDERALQVAVRGCAEPPEEATMVFIRDTLSLEHFYVSPSLRQIVEDHPRLKIVDEVPLSFADGTMQSPWQMEPAKVPA